tara:strand:- start:232 stop:912 length:681 start_codon:yes stop_codon:yes gene_type:complete
MMPLSTDILPVIQLETGPSPIYTIIWMHGLGADGNDFVPIVEALNLPADIPVRFIFPHAPMLPVSINNGLVMRSWYDIRNPQLDRFEDESGIRASQKAIETLIEQEIQNSMTSNHILLAGFSQGGVMALQVGLRYASKLAGIMALSCYLALAKTLEAEACSVNSSIPIFMAHGSDDPIVSISQAKTARKLLLDAQYPLEWHQYPMEHSVCAEEIVDISNWLRQILK